MNIHFNELQIRNFKSIKEANLKLNNRGIVTVIGVNNYENNASSNGSGKSSIFAGLFWALYGKTPEGIINPSNRLTNESCQVRIDFTVDSTSYIITRIISGGTHTVSLKINGEEAAARNRTDSDKVIKDSILHLSPELFLSLVYLSQGFGSRLSALPPSGRKDRLEQLTGTSEIVEAFSAKLTEINSSLSDEILKLNTEITKLSGANSSYQDVINSMKQKIQNARTAQNVPTFFEYEGTRYSVADLESITKQLSAATEAYQQQYKIFETHRLNESKLSGTRSQLLVDIERATVELQAIDKQLQELEVSKECPTCHQLMPLDQKEQLKSSLQDKRSKWQTRLDDNKASFDKVTEEWKTTSASIAEASAVVAHKQAERDRLLHIQCKIPVNSTNTVDIAGLEQEIKDYESKIAANDRQSLDLRAKLDKANRKNEIVRHCMQLTTKQFRTYLLDSAIAFLNSRLVEYSNQLFSNASDVICISADSSKLDIFVGDASYDTLSGGEKRRVDLAVTLAQKDLASEVAGISSNLLIMDEIMESMDEQATQTTLELLDKTSETVESLFIISHNNYAIASDSQIIITKEADQLSYLQEM